MPADPILITGGLGFLGSHRAFSIDKAWRVLGFEPRLNLQDSLRATIGWYRAQGWL